jgi:hypothetical protein
MRRLRPTGITSVAILVLLAVTGAGTAIAYFTTNGAGESETKTITALTQPTITTATPAAGGTVTLNWATVTAPGTGSVSYKVERNGGGANGTCASTLSLTNCVDSGLKAGTYTYVVTAKWRSWSATSSGKAATVAVGPVHHFVLSAATTTPTAGAADNLTITAKDEGGGTVTTYAGSKNLVFSGAPTSPEGVVPTVSDASGADVAFGAATAIEFTNGIATVSNGKNGAMKLYKSGSTSIKAGDGSLTTPTTLTVTASAATAAKFLLAASATSLTAGGSANLTITALDAYENTATGYTSTKSLTFSGASASPGNNKPTVSNSSGTATAFGTATTISFSSGVATVSTTKNGVMTLYDVEEASILVSDGTISSKAPVKVTVGVAAMSKLALTGATTTPNSGASDNLTTTAQDTYGNTVPSYTGAKSLTFSGASASPDGTGPTVSNSEGADNAFGTATSINFSEGVASVSGTKNGVMKLYKSGSTSVAVSDGTFSSGTLTVTVAAPAAKLLLAAATTTPVAAATDNLTITAQDTYNNVATTYTGSKNLTFSGASASANGTLPTVANSSGTATNFGTATAITFASGVASVSSTKNGVMKLYKAESASIAVTDGTVSSPAPIAVTVTPTTVSKWGLTSVKVSAGSLSANCIFTCTLTSLGNSGTVTAKVAATDTYGNVVSALGTGHAAKITTNGSGTISGSPLAIPATGPAESATTFTFTSKSSGTFTEIVTVAFSEGTAYTAATLTATK